MPAQDRYGLPLTTGSDAAAAAYREGMDLLLSAWPGAATAFERAIDADPGFALAHIARARVYATYAEVAAAKSLAAKARELAARNATPRERSHVETLALVIDGQPAKALACALGHLDKWPRDAIVMSLPLGAFGLFAFSGMANHDQARVDLCQRHARHYGDDWWFTTYLGWSLTENGDVTKGRQLSERAFGQRRNNANVIHALAHAMFEDGSATDADTLIADWLPSYNRAGLLYSHISWHQALAALEQGDAARALVIYTARIRPEVSAAAPLNVMTDGASLLWRLSVTGHPAPREMWDEVAVYADRTFPTSGNSFADVHAAIIAAATGNRASLDERIGELDARLVSGTLPSGPVVPSICRAVRAFSDGDYGTCASLLEPVARDVVRIGGSHAQREMIEDTLLVALMKSGDVAKAQSLLDHRLHRRLSQRNTAWRAGTVA
jgi:tetratricopeptide (TPR) repeat protein